MKKTLIALVLTTASVWAAPEGNVYHTIADPTWHVTRIGSRWVIEDSRGFFVGYYFPQPAPAPTPAPSSAPLPTAAAPTAPPVATQANTGSSYYNNGAYGYGYYGYGNNGFYGNNYYNGANCQPQCHQPEPALQPGRDKNDIPIGTPWNPAFK